MQFLACLRVRGALQLEARHWAGFETMKDIPMKPIDKDDEDSDRRMVILAIHKMPKDVNPKLDRPFEKFELYDVS